MQDYFLITSVVPCEAALACMGEIRKQFEFTFCLKWTWFIKISIQFWNPSIKESIKLSIQFLMESIFPLFRISRHFVREKRKIVTFHEIFFVIFMDWMSSFKFKVPLIIFNRMCVHRTLPFCVYFSNWISITVSFHFFSEKLFHGT